MAFARLYDWTMSLAERARLARWRRSVVESSRGLVLEIAAGTGLNFPHYTRDAVVVATEPDGAMLHRARQRVASARARIILVVADAEALPFRSATFDGAVVGLAMCTITHPDGALGELRRAIRPGGTVALLEHVRAPNRLFARLQAWLTPLWRRVAGGCRLDRDTVRAVADAGLRLERVDRHAAGIFVEIRARVPRLVHGETGHDARAP